MRGTNFAALSDALYEALEARQAAKTGRDASQARRQLSRVLRRLCAAAGPMRERLSRRGRKPSYDRTWAESQMLDFLAADPDGLPAKQCDLIDRLRLRFENDGRSIPSDSWLKQAVQKFYSRTEIAERDARKKFATSPALQTAFSSPSDFLAFCRMRDRLERKWLQSNDLQREYPAVGAYVAAVVAERPLLATRHAA